MRNIKSYLQIIKRNFSKILTFKKRVIKNFGKYALKSPEKMFFVLLGILLLLIIASNLIRNLKTDKTATQEKSPKKVSIYKIGQAPKIELEAKIEKDGSITLVSQTSGIITGIQVLEGQNIYKGSQLISISTTYSGANAAYLSAEIARVNYENAKSTYDAQKELLAKQREIAVKTEENAGELREIINKSLDETRSSLTLNEQILNSINENLNILNQATPSAENSTLILSTTQLKSQYLSAINALRQALRQSEYQESGDNPPAELARFSKDQLLKQLEIAEKTLETSLEISRLNSHLANINASFFSPSAPVNGTIDRVFVTLGQAVVPGTPLVHITGKTKITKANLSLPKNIAISISKLEPSIFQIGTGSAELIPEHISLSPVNGRNYSATFIIPFDLSVNLKDGDIIRVKVPVGYPESGAGLPIIPIDSVFQTQDESYVFVMSEGMVKSQKIDTGEILGRFVVIENGLQNGNQVILDRNVTPGEKVEEN